MKTAETKARILFAITLAAVGAGALAWYLLAAGLHTTYEIRTGESVSGLIAGAPVEFHGVEVGRVREVQLTDPRSVRILADIRRGTPVSAATRATITGRGLASRGFTGYVYVSLDDAGVPPAPLAAADGAPYPRIATAPGQTVSLDTSINQMNANVQAVTALLQSALDPQTVRSLQQSLRNLDKVTGTLAAHNAKLETLIANAERASVQLPPLLRTSQATVGALQEQVLPRAQATLLRLDGLSNTMNDRLTVILAHSEQASTRFLPLLEASHEAVRSLQYQLLPDAQRTLARLDQLSTTLDDTAGRIRRNPSLLLRGSAPREPGPGEAR
jgi:phospholipid/cholesterol/gamma-HCH transport system substrate-binding protein